MTFPCICSSKFEAKKWLDGEMEKILQKKQAMEELEKVYGDQLVKPNNIVAKINLGAFLCTPILHGSTVAQVAV